MPTIPHGGNPELSKFVERQMRNWEFSRAQRPTQRSGSPPHPVADFLTISRAVGSGGRQVATLLGERLKWPVFDREILQSMAGDDRVRAQLYEQMDERDVSWLEDAVHWLIRGEFRKEDYFHRLTETVLALARRGHAIFLGRGADLILPPDRGLRVRITASLEERARRFALANNITEAMARDEVERVDNERREFRRHHFGPAASEQARYDLVLVMDRFTPAQAVELLVTALRLRGIMA
jgi:hypothetical protein